VLVFFSGPQHALNGPNRPGRFLLGLSFGEAFSVELYSPHTCHFTQQTNTYITKNLAIPQPQGSNSIDECVQDLTLQWCRSSQLVHQALLYWNSDLVISKARRRHRRLLSTVSIVAGQRCVRPAQLAREHNNSIFYSNPPHTCI
jgi:hypothetical protein